MPGMSVVRLLQVHRVALPTTYNGVHGNYLVLQLYDYAFLYYIIMCDERMM